MNEQNAQYFKDMVKRATRFSTSQVPNGVSIDVYFKEHLQQEWQAKLFDYHLMLIKEKSCSSNKAMKNLELFLFITAAGLITYGKKEVIPFILQDIPKVGAINELINVVFELLPLPDDIDTQVKVLDWLENHYEQLTWDEAQEVFYLKEVE